MLAGDHPRGMPMRRFAPAVVAVVLVFAGAQPAPAQRAMSVVVSEAIESWTIVCTRDLVTDEVACAMVAPIEVFAGRSWQALDPAILTVTSEAGDGQPRPVIRLASPEFALPAAFRFDARRAVRVEGNCDESECRIADAFALPLATELARSSAVVMRGAIGHDLRAQVSGYAAPWTRLLAISAERAAPGEDALDLVAPDPAAVPPPPASPAINVRMRRTLR
jgi:hypothetical protein